MDGESSRSNGVFPKLKYKPKIPPRKVLRPPAIQRDKISSDEDVLSKHFQEGSGRSGANEKKSAPSQVTFEVGSASRDKIPKGPSNTLMRSATTNQGHPHCCEVEHGSSPKTKKEYVDPWDCSSYSPIVLPLRKPNSGNPETFDEREPEEASPVCNEQQLNSAAQLGLLENDQREQMIFFQLPSSLPFVKNAASKKGKEIIDFSKPSTRINDASGKGCRLEDLPAGLMGKMLVYKSGTIKMKLGDVLFDVSSGTNRSFHQEVAAINVQEKHICILGDLRKCGVVTPDIASLLDGNIL